MDLSNIIHGLRARLRSADQSMTDPNATIVPDRRIGERRSEIGSTGGLAVAEEDMGPIFSAAIKLGASDIHIEPAE